MSHFVQYRHDVWRLTLATLLVGLACTPAKAEDAPPANQPATSGSKFSYVGSVNCNRCHTRPLPQDTDSGAVDRIKLTEYDTWEHQDKHPDAFKILEGERGQMMSRLLGYDVTQDVRCLSCHSGHCWVTSTESGKAVVLNPPPVVKRPPDKVYEIRKEGVSCEACHGPASQWVKAHWDPDMDPPFRTLPAQLKQEKYGLNDVRQPTSRAEICLSCHLGNTSQGKLLTHDMYAVGHPPLPGFEIETFDAAMPAHAKLLHEKPLDTRPKASHPADDLYITRSVVTSGLVALREQARLLADQAGAAEAGVKNDDGVPAWPELALFDCRACHHDLRSTGGRSSVGEPGRPGRPAFQPWPLAIYLVAGGDEGKLAVLYKAFDRQPFGKAADVAPAARELQASVQARLDQIEDKGFAFNRAEGVRLLTRICEVDSRLYSDHDAARQLAWAFARIYGDVCSGPPGDTGAMGAKHRAEIDRCLEQMSEDLHLKIEPRPKTALDVAKLRLAAATNYDPQSFATYLKTLRALVPAHR